MCRGDIIKREFANTLISMAEKHSIDKISVTALTKECGLSRGTFYYHFADIFDLINWIFDNEIILPLQKCINENCMEGWSGITRYCLEKMYENKRFYCNCINMNKSYLFQEHMQKKNLESWNTLIMRYINETEKKVKIDNYSFIIQFTSQSVCNMVIEWLKNGMDIPVEIMAKMDDVATKGIYGV